MFNGEFYTGSVQFPTSVDGDSVYMKDINTTLSYATDWTGKILNLFDCPQTQTELYNSTSTSPKIVNIVFHRTIYLNAIGLGCNTGKTFSNTKIEFIGSDATVRYTYDDSANNTQYGTKLYSFPPTACVSIKLYFYTTNTVGLTNITIQKELSVSARIRALKPDGVITDIAATQTGNLKVSLEEFENNISVNTNTQLKVTPYQASGIEGNLISDDYGFSAECTPTDELRVTEPVRLIGTTFIGTTPDPNFTTLTTASSGTISQSNCQVTLATGTGSNGSVTLQSVRNARYTGGSANRARAIVRFPDTGTVNNVRKWGCYSSTDGAYFKLSDTNLYTCTLKTNVETCTASTTWSNSSFTLNTGVHTYEIYFTNTRVWFIIDGTLRHIYNATNSSWTDTTNLPLRADNTNLNTSTNNVSMEIRVATIYRLGKLETQPMSKYQSGITTGTICKYNAGNLRGIIVSNVTNTSNVKLFDNVLPTGTLLWSSGGMGAQTQPFDLDFHGIPFSTGLTLVISGAASDVFLAYE